MEHRQTKKPLWALLLLIAACTLPFSPALATAAAPPPTLIDGQQPPEGMPTGMGMGVRPIDTQNLTADQLQAYQAAKAAYEQAEDAILRDLVTAGVLQEAAVQTYQQTRAQQLTQQPIERTAQDATPPATDQGFEGNIWSQVMQDQTNTAVQSAIAALQQATQTYQQALANAGIDMMDRGMGRAGGQ